MKIDLKSLTISQAEEFIRGGCVSARDLAALYLDEIKKKNDKLNAYLEVFEDVLDEAEKADLKIKQGKEIGAIEGIPIAVKDNILIKGRKARAASKILENYTAPYDSYAIKKLKESGAIFLGRTNMDEFAMGSSTENSAFGITRNPFDEERVPGGSSGGSASAVAADMALAALGSDTGGSIRQPAAFCGVVGLKPTYGAVSRSGLIAMSSSLEQIGPVAKTVEDAKIIFEVIRGKDPKDSTTLNYPQSELGKNKLTIGVVKEFFEEKSTADEKVLGRVKESFDIFRSNNFEIKEVSLPHIKYSLACYYIIAPAEISANLARYDGVRYGKKEEGENLLEDYLLTRERGFGKEVKRRIMLGTYALSAGYYDAYYSKASKIRRIIKNDFEKVFKEVDVLIGPTSPTLPFKIGEKTSDPLKMYLSDLFTVPVNLAGLPAISVPFGKIGNLPVGVQLIAPWFKEELLFKMGNILENAKEE